MTIYPNIMGLKHALEAKKLLLISNRKISKNAKVSQNTVGRLIRADISLLYLETLSKLVKYFEVEGLRIEVGDFFDWQNGELLLNIGPLLTQLNPTPTEPEIASATGIPILRLENLIRGNVKRVYLDDLARLLVFFEERGVKIEVGDLLRVEG